MSWKSITFYLFFLFVAAHSIPDRSDRFGGDQSSFDTPCKAARPVHSADHNLLLCSLCCLPALLPLFTVHRMKRACCLCKILLNKFGWPRLYMSVIYSIFSGSVQLLYRCTSSFLCTFHKRLDCFSQVLSENKNNKKHNNNKNWEKVRLEVFLKRTRYGFRVMSIFISVLGTMSKCHASKIKNLHNKLWNSNGGWFQTCWLMQDSPCLQNMNIGEALKQFTTLAEFWVGIYTLSIWPHFFEYSLSFVHSNWNCANGCVWGCVCVLHLQLVHFIRLAMRRSPERAFTWPVLDIQQDFFFVSVWSMPTPSSEKMGRAVRRVTDYGGYCSSYVNFRKTQLCFQSHSKLGCVFLILLNLSADWGQADPESPPQWLWWLLCIYHTPSFT